MALFYFKYYKDDPTLQSMDAFICSFPLSQCEVFSPSNKTIIFAAAHRYAMRRCTPSLWQSTSDAKSTSPRHFAAALSQYDAEYINYFTGLQPIHLFSSSKPYVPHKPFKPMRPEILVGPLNSKLKALPLQLYASGMFKFATAHSLYRRFKLSQLLDHRAAVIFPYAVMSYGITELCAMAVPLFVPSQGFTMRLELLYPKTGP